MKPVPQDDLAALVSQIAQTIAQARSQVRQSVNQAMVASYSFQFATQCVVN